MTFLGTPAVRVRTAFLGVFGLAATLWGAGCGGPDYPKCDTDQDCHQGEYCVNGMCQQCRGDADCPAGKHCAAGACQPIPGYCTSSSDCPSGQECVNNMCVNQTQSVAPPPPAAPVASGCSLESVYFDFDSSTLDQSSRDKLSTNANCIKSKGLKSVHLTGLTDPRGSEEYNLALGDRRAQQAKKFMESMGVSGLSASSMGEELATGSDESSWSRDRRVDFQEK